MTKHVIIFGGGISGLSAAHELCERGFQVTIYERWGVPGGKARSTWVPVPAKPPAGVMPPLLSMGRQPSADPAHELPGEHGFRFFPNFYRHLCDTMRRTPAGGGGKSALDNLVPAPRMMTTAKGTAPVIYLQTMPRSLADLEALFVSFMESGAPLTDAEIQFLLDRIWQIATSCPERRLDEYEKLSWWQYLNADAYSPAYQQLTSISRLTVAANPRLAETRTMGDIALQMLNINLSPIPKDRVLNGPTNPAWIDPWVQYLQSRGTTIHYNCAASAISCASGKIQSVTVASGDHTQQVTGDYYLFCVPVDVMAQLLAGDVVDGKSSPPVYRNVLAADPTLASILELAGAVEWMNGIQYYLNVDLSITDGHVMFLDTPWAITAISQHQFWPTFDLAGRYDGKVKGILSVDISDWTKDSPHLHKPARDCTLQEIAEEVWRQMKESINGPGREVLRDDMVHAYHVDTDISAELDPTPHDRNAEPLLVNQPNMWGLRPGAFTRIPNLFLAGDYVRTNTMLATMETANEAARRATNAILAAEGRRDLAKIWPLEEPLLLAPWRLYDRWRHLRGLPWSPRKPWILLAITWLLFRVDDLWRLLHGAGGRLRAAARPPKG